MLWLTLAIAVAWRSGDPWAFANGLNQAMILCQAVIVAVAACGMTLIIVAGGIDLAAGSLIALTGVIAAQVLAAGGGVGLALLAALTAGAGAGALTGLLTGWLRLPAFIVTLGMLGMLRGAAKRAAGDRSSQVLYEHAWLDRLMLPSNFQPGDPCWHIPLAVAPGVWIALAVIAVTWVLMARSVFGRHLYLLGSNPAAARLCGVPVLGLTVAVYAVGGLYLGLAGVLETARLGLGDATTAQGRELDIIAAVVIGGTALSGGRGSVLGSAIGALMMVTLRNGITMLGARDWLQDVIIGAVIVAAAAVDRFRGGAK
jgi:ribose/xylose/arabinose/galactoside ABC-type transport system permease subunit